MAEQVGNALGSSVQLVPHFRASSLDAPHNNGGWSSSSLGPCRYLVKAPLIPLRELGAVRQGADLRITQRARRSRFSNSPKAW